MSQQKPDTEVKKSEHKDIIVEEKNKDVHHEQDDKHQIDHKLKHKDDNQLEHRHHKHDRHHEHENKKIFEFQEFHVPEVGEYKEVKNDVYINVSTDKDGKQKYERTFDRSVANAHDGKLIAERRQRYENDSGLQRETHERQLDNKVLKKIDERNNQGEWVSSYKKRDIEDDEHFLKEFKEHNDSLAHPLQVKLWDEYPQLH